MDIKSVSAPDDQPQGEPSGFVDNLTPWFLIAFSILAAIGAVIRVIGDGKTSLSDRLNETTLIYLAMAAALLLLKRIKTLSFGSYKLEMLEQIRERQIKQEDLLKDITSRLLPILLAEPERKHLMFLSQGTTRDYERSVPLQSELRRLRSIGLLRMKKRPDGKDKTITGMGNGPFDLAELVELTPFGEQWVKSIREMEAVATPTQS